MKPTVRTVSAAQTMVNIIRIPRFDRVPPGGDRLREVIRVDGVAGTPTFQFFKSLAEVFQNLVVDEFDLTLRRHYCNQAGDAIDDQAKSLFALTEGSFIAVQVRVELGVLERDSGLWRQPLHDHDPVRPARPRRRSVGSTNDAE